MKKIFKILLGMFLTCSFITCMFMNVQLFALPKGLGSNLVMVKDEDCSGGTYNYKSSSGKARLVKTPYSAKVYNKSGRYLFENQCDGPFTLWLNVSYISSNEGYIDNSISHYAIQFGFDYYLFDESYATWSDPTCPSISTDCKIYLSISDNEFRKKAVDVYVEKDLVVFNLSEPYFETTGNIVFNNGTTQYLFRIINSINMDVTLVYWYTQKEGVYYYDFYTTSDDVKKLINCTGSKLNGISVGKSSSIAENETNMLSSTVSSVSSVVLSYVYSNYTCLEDFKNTSIANNRTTNTFHSFNGCVVLNECSESSKRN